MAGRPTKYTPEVVTKMLDAIRMGATYELAAGYAGVSKDSFERWRKNKADFAARIKEAEGVGAIGWLAKIEKAASDGTWQAAAWKLERRYPSQYGRTVKEHVGPNGGPVQIRTIEVVMPNGGDDDDGTLVRWPAA